MAIQFNETVAQWLTSDYNFPTAGAYRNVRLVLDLSAPTEMEEVFVAGNATGTVELTLLNIHTIDDSAYTSGKFIFKVFWSGAYALWYSTNSVLSTGINEIFVTYDGSSTVNDPVFYVNGVSVAVTRSTAPSGTLGSNSSINCTIGGVSKKSPLGKLLACNFITGRIVSAAEVLDAYNSRLATPNLNGLVFSPNLNGAAGLQTFDGTTLGVTNYIYDHITGTKFTPKNSPVGAADTYLNWK